MATNAKRAQFLEDFVRNSTLVTPAMLEEAMQVLTTRGEETLLAGLVAADTQPHKTPELR